VSRSGPRAASPSPKCGSSFIVEQWADDRQQVTGEEARAIAEAECRRRGLVFPEPVTVKLAGWLHRKWFVRAHANVRPGGPNVWIDAQSGQVRGIQKHVR
jgi:hypothetical protein